MKKITSLLLLICVLLQFVCMPVVGVQTDEEDGNAPSSFGSTPVTSGCRTINGMSPLGGSERKLDTAQAAFIYEMNTETVIYGYNPDLRLYPGSLSKVLTAFIAIEQGNLSDQITVSTREISQLPARTILAKPALKNGEVITLEDALHLLILESANDAALVIAEYVAGSEDAFVEIMNERAQELGCTNTVFTNCHGLDEAGQYTTARDIARIVVAATKNETFCQIFKEKEYDMKPTNKYEKERNVKSGNHLVYEMVLQQFNDIRVTGGMPSYVSAEAGASIVFTAEDNGLSMVYVIMGASRIYADNGWKVKYYGNFEESLDLLEYSFSEFKIKQVLYEGQSLNQFPVANGECDVVGQPNESIVSALPVLAHMKNLTFQYIPAGGGLQAPIQKGDLIATVQVWYGSSCITEAKLYAMNSVRAMNDTGVEIQGGSRDDSGIAGFFGFLGTVFLIILIGLGGYLGYNYLRRSMRRSRRRRRRASRRRSR